MHVHAVLMGRFLLLLLTQSILGATGRLGYHRTLGVAAFVVGPAVVIAGFVLAPMLLWDLIRTRTPHRAYVIWFLVTLPFAVLTNLLWGTPWWHATARSLMGA